ncbi:MAG: triose-phosphate isomerase [Akkermansia sp.]
MSRTPIIAANWKMNMGPQAAREFLAALKDELTCAVKPVDKVIVPPFVTIPAVMEVLNGCDCVGVGAQDVSDRDNGAFTGEISTDMLNELGCKYVVLGHSERRQYHGETNAYINKKIKKALAAGIIPIYCIGETLEQREGGQLETVLKTQVVEGLEGLTAEQVAGLVIAYEPVWAIGTGVTASTADAQSAHAFIRGVVAEACGAEAAAAVRIQYGGSVKPDNAVELMAQEDIDGALVGGAALVASSFAAIIKAAI